MEQIEVEIAASLSRRLMGYSIASRFCVRWYHDTMTKNLTIRIPDDVAANAEAIARVDGVSLNETVKQSLVEAVERRRKNPEFKARLKKIIEEDRELLERLAK